MYLRANNIPEHDFLDHYIFVIFNIGNKLQYPACILNRCHNTAKKNITIVPCLEKMVNLKV